MRIKNRRPSALATLTTLEKPDVVDSSPVSEQRHAVELVVPSKIKEPPPPIPKASVGVVTSQGPRTTAPSRDVDNDTIENVTFYSAVALDVLSSMVVSQPSSIKSLRLRLVSSPARDDHPAAGAAPSRKRLRSHGAGVLAPRRSPQHRGRGSRRLREPLSSEEEEAQALVEADDRDSPNSSPRSPLKKRRTQDSALDVDGTRTSRSQGRGRANRSLHRLRPGSTVENGHLPSGSSLRFSPPTNGFEPSSALPSLSPMAPIKTNVEMGGASVARGSLRERPAPLSRLAPSQTQMRPTFARRLVGRTFAESQSLDSPSDSSHSSTRPSSDARGDPRQAHMRTAYSVLSEVPLVRNAPMLYDQRPAISESPTGHSINGASSYRGADSRMYGVGQVPVVLRDGPSSASSAYVGGGQRYMNAPLSYASSSSALPSVAGSWQQQQLPSFATSSASVAGRVATPQYNPSGSIGTSRLPDVMSSGSMLSMGGPLPSLSINSTTLPPLQSPSYSGMGSPVPFPAMHPLAPEMHHQHLPQSQPFMQQQQRYYTPGLTYRHGGPEMRQPDIYVTPSHPGHYVMMQPGPGAQQMPMHSGDSRMAMPTRYPEMLQPSLHHSSFAVDQHKMQPVSYGHVMQPPQPHSIQMTHQMEAVQPYSQLVNSSKVQIPSLMPRPTQATAAKTRRNKFSMLTPIGASAAWSQQQRRQPQSSHRPDANGALKQ